MTRAVKAAPAAAQKAKGARPNRVKKAAQGAVQAVSGQGLGPCPPGMPESVQRHWEFARANFRHLTGADEPLVACLVLAQVELGECLVEGSRADRTALRKEIAGYLAALSCLPWQRRRFDSDAPKDDPTEALLASQGV